MVTSSLTVNWTRYVQFSTLESWRSPLAQEAIQALLRDKMFRNMVGQPIANGDGDDEEYEDEDDDGISEAWSEEVLFTSPLDDVDTYVRFATVLSSAFARLRL